MNVLNQLIDSAQRWAMYQGDCVETLRGIPDNSIHYSIFSPPFASLYTYSNSDRDMGNSSDGAEFGTAFRLPCGRAVSGHHAGAAGVHPLHEFARHEIP